MHFLLIQPPGDPAIRAWIIAGCLALPDAAPVVDDLSLPTRAAQGRLALERS
ncbi:hypothetical protein H7A76_24000 [Pseudomonas sp. MSSRFD41]|uniref:hypothetical protein n=1 Tax=unclassified Pseudomonas TaxID=196821 RepID=UPI001639DAED|nr:hypothetical protein [Pseudomonas sp. MSSRFD41]MBC2658511.1 hypothetical protein [Pseudomonas sp. MSSRFD41]